MLALGIFSSKSVFHIKKIANNIFSQANDLFKNHSLTASTIFKSINFPCRDYICLDHRIPIFFANSTIHTSIKHKFDKFTKSINQTSLQIGILLI